MKPISIRFKCFGPYLQEQFIDFTQLEQNGLFLICGETGSGKTTILDAISYALYGKSSGALRGDLSVMRCKLAGAKDETLVEFIFSCNGRRYRFTRGLKCGRKNLNDFHDCAEWVDGVYVPIFENPKLKSVNEKAEQLVGLTYEQFRQVIVLPQGQFERLLVSKSEEKEAILVSLFHADRWQKIAQEVFYRVSARDQDIKRQRMLIQSKLLEYGCTDIESLNRMAEDTANQLIQKKEQVQIAEQALAQIRKQNEQALLDSKDFRELKQIQSNLDKLMLKTRHFDLEQKILDMAHEAEEITPSYSAFQTAKDTFSAAQTRLDAASQKLQQAERSFLSAKRAREEHEAGSQRYTQQKARIVLLEDARALYNTLGQKKTRLDEAQSVQNDCENAASNAQDEFTKADGAWMEAQQRQSRAIGDYQTAQRKYLSGIGSVLAQRLVDGMPCPVCGSSDHPFPAKPTEDHISEAQLEKYNKAMNLANDAVSKTLRERTAAENQRNKAEDALNTASKETAGAAAEYAGALERKIAGIDTTQQLEEEISALVQSVGRYEDADSKTRSTLNDAIAGQKAAYEGVDTARKELSGAEEAYSCATLNWTDVLQNSGFDNESQYLASCMDAKEKQRRQGELIQFHTDLEHEKKRLEKQNQALNSRQEPDLAGIKIALGEAEAAAKAANDQHTLLNQRVSVMQEDAVSLAERDEKLTIQRLQVDEDLVFAKRLRGDTGSSLQRYVLGVMLTAITQEANRLLENVYGGRYRLYRSDESTGKAHKKGLELEVYDSAQNAFRSVTTLSGGEKFLVALSLAIGLSTVVQAQGHGLRLEAMFVDEGFGSLDRDSVCDALEVLQGIQRSAGIVGIISHVEQLAETIPAKIQITKTETGSKCTVVC